MLTQRAMQQLARSAATRSLSSSLPRSSPANSHTAVAVPPTVANSSLLLTNRDEALWTPGLRWRDEEQVGVGFAGPEAATELKESDLRAEDEGGRVTEKMKCVPLSTSQRTTKELTPCARPQHVPGHPLRPPVPSCGRAHAHPLSAALRSRRTSRRWCLART